MKKKQEFTDVLSECRAMKRLAGGMSPNNRVEFTDDDQPRTCMKTGTIYLPRPQFSWGPHERKVNRGSAWHEHGHHHPSQKPLVELMDREKIAYNSLAGMYINIIDDLWQEQISSTNFIGVADDLDYLQAHLAERGLKLMDQGKKFDMNSAKALGMAYEARGEWQPRLKPHAHTWGKRVDYSEWSHLTPRLNKIIDHPEPAEEVWAIVREMLQASGEDEKKAKKGDKFARVLEIIREEIRTRVPVIFKQLMDQELEKKDGAVQREVVAH